MMRRRRLRAGASVPDPIPHRFEPVHDGHGPGLPIDGRLEAVRRNALEEDQAPVRHDVETPRCGRGCQAYKLRAFDAFLATHGGDLVAALADLKERANTVDDPFDILPTGLQGTPSSN